MKLKHWIASAMIAIVLATAGVALTGCKNSEPSSGGAASGSQTQQYTCSMHPDVVQNSPGKCPKCGMELTVKK